MNAKPAHRPVRLGVVLGYRNPGVVARYCREHNVATAEGEDVFREMLKADW